MIKLDLVTGLLGSGKTTFIKNYIDHLKSKNLKVCLIVNDYGAVNVDTLILNTLGVDIESVASACDSACHIRRLKTKLITIIMKHYDYVIIEPSGIFDTDELFDLMYEEPIASSIEINNIFCLYDINNKKLSEEEEYFFVSESSVCGRLIVTKRDSKNILIDLDYLNSLYKKYNCPKILTSNDILYNDSIDYDNLNIGYNNYPHIKMPYIDSNEFSSLYILDKDITEEKLDSIKDILFNDPRYGNVLRIKGFIYTDKYYLINITKDSYLCEEIKEVQKVLIIIGRNLNKEKIEELFD